jgi:hypothetical protein
VNHVNHLTLTLAAVWSGNGGDLWAHPLSLLLISLGLFLRGYQAWLGTCEEGAA